MRKLRWLLAGLYVLLVCVLFVGGMVAAWGDASAIVTFVVLVGLAIITQLLFILTPGRQVYLKPTRRRRLLVPAILAALMMAVLISGLCFSFMELYELDEPSWMLFWLIMIMIWAAWTCLFYLYCRRLDHYTAARRMIGYVLSGSLLQLFATVPSHVIVSRRPGCFVGIATSIGLFAGLYVMVWSFGPGIALLFWNEIYKRRAGRCASCGYDLRLLTTRRCPECGQPFRPTELRPTERNGSEIA